VNGLVTKSTGSWYTVLDEATGTRTECRLRGQFRIRGIKDTNPVVVGDRVTWEPGDDGTGSITAISPRTNYIERKSTNLSKIRHLIAANIDLAFLVVTSVNHALPWASSTGFWLLPKVSVSQYAWYSTRWISMKIPKWLLLRNLRLSIETSATE